MDKQELLLELLLCGVAAVRGAASLRQQKRRRSAFWVSFLRGPLYAGSVRVPCESPSPGGAVEGTAESPHTKRWRELSLAEVLQKLLQHLPRSRPLFSFGTESFSGTSATDALKRALNVDQDTAILVGQQLLDLDVWCEVPYGKNYTFECTDSREYALQLRLLGNVFNFLFRWCKPAASPLPLLQHLLKGTLDLFGAHLSADRVDLAAVCADQRSLDLFVNCCELQQVDLQALQTHNQQKAFFLNLYHLTHRLALLQKSSTEFFVATSGPPLGSTSLSSFPISAGALPLKQFEELTLAVRVFLSDPKNFQFADGGRSLRLSQLLETFQGDFGSTQREAIAYLLPFLNGSESEMLRQLLQMEGPRSSRGSSGGIAEAVVGGFLRLFGGLKVSYSPVDWQSPFLPHKPFDSRGHIL
ncbi:guanine nucleotide exchange related protein [Cyclospora cayetanensis]|uniref:Guanine nucleotide exchange related protein n=1 Tax=Cyclospora cayetanensis TaxID=88456 RepID=A0A1D3D6R0_9EIME|nr:guanine nucleotide exchange related protein [Cyclospora cayetanensis]